MSYASRVRGSASPTKPAPAAKFIAGLSGLQVTLELASGERYRGVLLQKSCVSTYCLGQVQLLTKDPDSPNLNRFEDERSFDASQVACMRLPSESLKGDRNEPHGEFKTDAEIRMKPSEKSMRSLEKWDGGDDDGTSMSLDQEAKLRPEDRGWDQFKVNQKLFGYQSSYAEENYTTSIDRHSEFYRQNEPKARKVAAEIENEASDNLHIAEERGQQISHDVDEESRYSTVLDQPKSSAADVYRQPALRNKSPENDRASEPTKFPQNGSSNRDKSPPRPASSKNTSPVQSVSSENTSPAKANVPANQKACSKSPQRPESVNGYHEEEKRPESGSDSSKSFQFNAGAKEFVPAMTVPGLYFADGSYMPIVESPSPVMPPMGIYPAYGFSPYYTQYSPMGYVNQPMMFPAPGNYPAFQAQQNQNPNNNRSRPQSRSSKPNQPQTKQHSNTPEPNADS